MESHVVLGAPNPVRELLAAAFGAGLLDVGTIEGDPIGTEDLVGVGGSVGVAETDAGGVPVTVMFVVLVHPATPTSKTTIVSSEPLGDIVPSSRNCAAPSDTPRRDRAAHTS